MAVQRIGAKWARFTIFCGAGFVRSSAEDSGNLCVRVSLLSRWKRSIQDFSILLLYFFSTFCLFLISSSDFDGPALLSQEDCASITSRSLRVPGLGFAFVCWGFACGSLLVALTTVLFLLDVKSKEILKNWRSPFIMCFGLGMPSIKAQQLTHAFKEDGNPIFKPFPVRQTPHPRCSENRPDDDIYETAQVNQKNPLFLQLPKPRVHQLINMRSLRSDILCFLLFQEHS